MNNPTIEWKTIRGRECLYFTFNGKLIEADAQTAVAQWKTAFAAKPDGKIRLVWNCLQMKDYDKPARQLWQNALMEQKDRIQDIWLIAHSILITIGASVISTFTKLDISVVAKEEDIP